METPCLSIAECNVVNVETFPPITSAPFSVIIMSLQQPVYPWLLIFDRVSEIVPPIYGDSRVILLYSWQTSAWHQNLTARAICGLSHIWRLRVRKAAHMGDRGLRNYLEKEQTMGVYIPGYTLSMFYFTPVCKLSVSPITSIYTTNHNQHERLPDGAALYSFSRSFPRRRNWGREFTEGLLVLVV